MTSQQVWTTCLIAGYLTGLIGLIPYGIFVFTLLVRKKSHAPKRAVVFLVWGFCVVALQAVLRAEPERAILTGIGTAFWGMYFEKSKRVAATFGMRETP